MYTNASKEQSLKEKSGPGLVINLDLKAYLVLGLSLCADVLPFKPLGIIKKISSKSPSQGS
jgi:hypothetical protein